MHLALASAKADPAIVPEPLRPHDLRMLSSDLTEHATRVFDALKDALPKLPDEVVEQAGLVLSRRRQFLNAFRALSDAEITALRTRIHGDYHLGQVLVVKGDYVILDFEGEPARSLAERRAKHSPLKDVAGMLRSFSYAVWAALLNYTSRHPEDFDRLEPWGRLWEQASTAEFLRGYFKAIEGSPVLPATGVGRALLLHSYLADKALYELHYELNNRPAWVRIPMRGILALRL
jgi:maltose alpha-D-glucosyltransferase/alpha-amylase